MRGFVINIRKAKNEDVIVTVLSSDSVKKYWRFFGTRHSILRLGNLIDFNIDESKKGFLPNMRSLSQVQFPWLFWEKHCLIWQKFIALFEPHLKDSLDLDPFYFNILLDIAQKWDKQNPKRLAIEAYIEILKYEKRLHSTNFCYICQTQLREEIGLMRAFIPAHPQCINSSTLNKRDIFRLFDTASTIHLDDDSISKIYEILLKGL